MADGGAQNTVPTGGGDSLGPSGQTGPNVYIDIDELAEKVYQLMLAEVRLARARGMYPHGTRKG